VELPSLRRQLSDSAFSEDRLHQFTTKFSLLLLKNSVLRPKFFKEFVRLQVLATEAGEPVVPTLSRSMISSFAFYNRLILRRGAAVGGRSLQHVLDFAEDCALTPESEENEAGCIEFVIDYERDEKVAW
jgi:hypothetical protein